MSDKESRLNKYEKRRKNTKAISILLIIGSVLLLFLIGSFFFGGSDNKSHNQDDNDSNLSMQESSQNEKAENNDETEEKVEADDEEQIEKENVAPSDNNVVEAYEANWAPVGTQQEGEHITQFEKETQDWKEMEHAASVAAELDEDNMQTLWIENGGGSQKTIATVSDLDESEIYRVYLTWVDDEGWQPTKVEILKENDKKL